MRLLCRKCFSSPLRTTWSGAITWIFQLFGTSMSCLNLLILLPSFYICYFLVTLLCQWISTRNIIYFFYYDLLCSLETLSKERKILFVSLYFLIWGEAANIRFLPECLCYIFHHVSFLGTIYSIYTSFLFLFFIHLTFSLSMLLEYYFSSILYITYFLFSFSNVYVLDTTRAQYYN